MALRAESDAIRIITDRLKVKEMGPADHIRTKHEVKTFVESAGNLKQAATLIERAHARRTLQQSRDAAIKVSENRGQNMSQ